MILLAVLLLLKLIVVFWSVDKGFDFTDEGFYLVGYNHYELYETFDYYLIIGKLLFFVDWNITSLRVAKIIVEIVSICIFCYGFHTWMRSKNSIFRDFFPGLTVILLFAGIGSFLSVFARGVSYNDFSNLTIYSASCCLFLLLAAPSNRIQKSWRMLMIAALAGFLAGIQFFVKFPASLLFSVVVIIMTSMALPDVKASRKMTLLLFYFGGYFAFLSIFFLTYDGGLSHWIEKTQRVFEFNKLGAHGIKDVLEVYLVDLFFPSRALVGIVLFLICYLLMRRLGVSLDLRLILSGLIGLVCLSIFVYVEELAGICESVFIFNVLSIFFLLVVQTGIILKPLLKITTMGIPIKINKIELHNSLVIGLLWLLPFIIMVGTDDNLSKTLPQHITPWLMLFLAALYYLWHRYRVTGWVYVSLAVVVATTTFHFVFYYVYHPLGLTAPLTAQRYTVDELEKIKFDSLTAEFLNGFMSLMDDAGFKKGDPVIALDHNHGLVYLIGGISPETPYYVSKYHNGSKFNCYHINNFALSEESRKPIVIYVMPPDDELAMCFKNSELRFPDTYDYVGEIEKTTPSIYNDMFQLEGYTRLKVYAPRQIHRGDGN